MMGYQTCYTLTIAQLRSQHPDGRPFFYEPQLVQAPPEIEEAIIAQLREENEDAQLALDSVGNSSEYVKWYDCDKEMQAFSQKHPDYIFVLEGQGEDNDDRWLAYIHKGQIQMCPAIISYPPLDKAKLGIAAADPGRAEALGKHFFLITYNDSGQESHFFVTTNDGRLSEAAAAHHVAQEWGLEEINQDDLHLFGPVAVDHLDRL